MRHRVIFGKPLPRGLLKGRSPVFGGIGFFFAVAIAAVLAAVLRPPAGQGDEEMVYFWPD